MSLHRTTVAALLAAFALSVSGLSAAQDDVGMFEDSDYTGAFDDATRIGQDDWYYDAYDMSVEQEDAWYSDTEWYSDEYYSGLYDDNTEDDWFFDSYDDAGDEGLFDI